MTKFTKPSIKKTSTISNKYNKEFKRKSRQTRISFSPELIENPSYNQIVPTKTKKDINGNYIYNVSQLEKSNNNSLIAQKIGKFIAKDEYKDFNEVDSEIVEKVILYLKLWNRLTKQICNESNFVKLILNSNRLGFQKTENNIKIINYIYNKIIK